MIIRIMRLVTVGGIRWMMMDVTVVEGHRCVVFVGSVQFSSIQFSSVARSVMCVCVCVYYCLSFWRIYYVNIYGIKEYMFVVFPEKGPPTTNTSKKWLILKTELMGEKDRRTGTLWWCCRTGIEIRVSCLDTRNGTRQTVKQPKVKQHTKPTLQPTVLRYVKGTTNNKSSRM